MHTLTKPGEFVERKNTWLDNPISHNAYRQNDPVELIEATPGARLCQALEDPSQALVVHLVGAVEDHAVLPKRLCHVFHRLRFPSAFNNMYQGFKRLKRQNSIVLCFKIYESGNLSKLFEESSIIDVIHS